MSIAHAYGPGRFGLSFEFFPPKTEAGERTLYGHVERLMAFKPSFITVTYGAGGSTQDKTLAIAARIRAEYDLPVATHLTCVGRTPDEIRQYLADAVERGVENVVALRGDPPQGETEFRPVEGGFSYANELVEMIHHDFPSMGVAVGGYPEVHQEAPSRKVDMENLKRKVDAGADVVMTQLFYDNEDFYRFRDDCDAMNLGVPIVPGLLPIASAGQVKRITSMCGAKLPATLVDRLDAAGDDNAAQASVGAEFAHEQTEDLVGSGVPGIHFYVLNKSEPMSRVLGDLGLGGTPSVAATL
ncbi:MAG: methylenetetrahydrofolate reductase [NAD(P)H] [Planctomycetota bacterium]